MTKPEISVLHLIGGLHLDGGTELFARALAAVPLAGIQQRIWMQREFAAPEPAARFVTRGRARRINLNLRTDLQAALQDCLPLSAWVRTQARPVLHGHSRAGIFAGCLARWLTGAPLVIHLHFLASHQGLYRALRRLTGAPLVFNSNKTCRHFGDDPRRSMVLMPPSAWRTRVPETRGGPTRFVAAGTFVPSKHFQVLIEAFHRLRARGVEAELHIFGLSNTPNDPGCQQRLISAAAGDKNIALHGWTRDWLEGLTANDIFVHLGHPEAFGMATLEAFAAGCRLVVLRDTFLDELPEPCCSTGIYRLARLDAAGAAAAMELAFRQAVDAAAVWEQRKAVSSRFELASSAAALKALYESLARDSRAG